MIECFLEMHTGFYPAPFVVLFCRMVPDCGYTLKQVNRVVSFVRFLPKDVFECDMLYAVQDPV